MYFKTKIVEKRRYHGFDIFPATTLICVHLPQTLLVIDHILFVLYPSSYP